ncbi:MAG: hypothetical protein OHK0039_01640 [Bacteroidia bacterium]
MLHQGSYSGATQAAERLIGEQIAWEAAWQMLMMHQTPMPACPAIDFSRQCVVFVALGEQVAGGHSIGIAQVVATADLAWLVQVTHTAPGAGCFTTEALTQPYCVVRVDAPAPATIEFQTAVVRTPCE